MRKILTGLTFAGSLFGAYNVLSVEHELGKAEVHAEFANERYDAPAQLRWEDRIDDLQRGQNLLIGFTALELTCFALGAAQILVQAGRDLHSEETKTAQAVIHSA